MPLLNNIIRDWEFMIYWIDVVYLINEWKRSVILSHTRYESAQLPKQSIYYLDLIMRHRVVFRRYKIPFKSSWSIFLTRPFQRSVNQPSPPELSTLCSYVGWHVSINMLHHRNVYWRNYLIRFCAINFKCCTNIFRLPDINFRCCSNLFKLPTINIRCCTNLVSFTCH